MASPSVIGTPQGSSDTASASSWTVSYTVAATGQNRALLVWLGASGSDALVSGVTYAGSAMTKLIAFTAVRIASTTLWYIANPSTGANNIIVSYTEARTDKSLIAFALQDIVQSSPLDITGQSDVVGGTALTKAITTTVDGDLIVGNLMVGGGASGITQDAGQTLLATVSIGFWQSGSYIAQASAGAITTGNTWTTGTNADYFVVSLKYLAPSPEISVSDQLNITESATVTSQLAGISVSDQINITESAQVEVAYLISVSDQINITESVTLSGQLGGISVSDQLNITESVQMEVVSYISSSDQLNITESAIADIVNPISVSDQINITESAVVAVPFLGDLSVSDQITITDVPTILVLEYFISISDQLNINEGITLEIVSFISVSDQLTISESVSIEGVYSVSVSDQLTISENVEINEISDISVSDQLNLTEDIINSVQLGGISVSDQIDITESITVAVPELGGVSVNDQLNLTEDITISLQLGDVSISDQLNITESITISVQLGDISVSDSITISEDDSQTGTIFINISDQIDITESTTVTVPTLGGISVNDSLTISEDISFDTIRFSPGLQPIGARGLAGTFGII